MPVATRTPSYKNLGRWAVEVFAVHLHHPNPSPGFPPRIRGTGHAFDRENDELGAGKEELRGENDDEGDFFASASPLARIIDDC